jgi:hypothetical protein
MPTRSSGAARAGLRWTRRGRLAARVALVAAGCVAGCLLGELAIRLVLGEQPKFARHVVRAPWGIRYNDPSSRYRHRSADVDVEFMINRQGMRCDHDVEHAKPAGRRRIVSLGDSFTIGYEVAATETFSSVLEARLRAAGLDVEVLNCGVSGFSNAEECLYLERELLKYSPDLVLVSFFENDLDDNPRSGLFRIDGDELVVAAQEYIPGGELADWLNRSSVFNFLSERSDAFVFVKESLTDLLKHQPMARVPPKGPSDFDAAPAAGAGKDAIVAPPATPKIPPEDRPKRKLCARIFDRIYAVAQAHGIPFVIMSIPGESPAEHTIAECFPLEEFDVHRPGLEFVSTYDLLQPWNGKELLYWRRSHHHWTPFAHRLAGEELARRILDKKLLP